MNEQELFESVEKSIQAVLNTEDGEIKLESSLVGDLGAESIDFLDISCELEKFIDKELDFKEVMADLKEKNGGTDVNDLTVSQLVSYLKVTQ